jgi:2-succinyl-6-hydroxy-2,4-cyclohexadiene-1-carboxylate synthase
VPEELVLLHGFAGTRRAWDQLAGRLAAERYRPLALDLPGHGPAADAGEVPSMRAAVVSVLGAAPERFALCGYSLGGRVALNVALAAPERVQRLILVSTSAGIEDAGERAARGDADERIAVRLERDPLQVFAAAWNAQPLFAADPPRVLELAVADIMRNRGDALAAALRGLGAGAMEPLWDRLGELQMPALVLAGERDARYVQLGQRLARALPAGRLEVLPGGHRLALESPAALAAALEAGAATARAVSRTTRSRRTPDA